MSDSESQDREASTSSRSLKTDGFDKLSGFFTPVWESKRRDHEETEATFSQTYRAKSAKEAEARTPRRDRGLTESSQPLAFQEGGSRTKVSTVSRAATPKPPSIDTTSRLTSQESPVTSDEKLQPTSDLPVEMSSPTASDLLRRLRRTLRLYTPLPEDIRSTLTQYRIK